jgi:hypothetical protein
MKPETQSDEAQGGKPSPLSTIPQHILPSSVVTLSLGIFLSSGVPQVGSEQRSAFPAHVHTAQDGAFTDYYLAERAPSLCIPRHERGESSRREERGAQYTIWFLGRRNDQSLPY